MAGEERPPDQVVGVGRIERARALGEVRVTTSASLGWLVDGYVGAWARFREVAGRHPPDARATFAPLFEALNWAVAIDDYAEKRQGRPFGDEIVRGVRFARNRVHHQWADALEPEPFRQISRVAGREVERSEHSWWFWRPADRLPQADVSGRARGEPEYRARLEGRLVDDALEHLDELYRRRAAE